ARTRFASPVAPAYQRRRKGLSRSPRSPSSAATRWNGVPLGTRSHSPSAAAIFSGALSSRHASAERPATDTPRSTTSVNATQIALRMTATQLSHEALGRRADGDAPPIELGDGPDPEQRVRHEQLVCPEQLGRLDIALLGANAEPPRCFEDNAAHDALDAAAREARRSELAAADDEDVAGRALRDTATRVEHEPLLHGLTAQLELREHLLETAQVLDPGKRRILSEPQPAGAHADAVAIVRVRIVGPLRDREHPRRRRGLGRQVTARAGTASHDELDDDAALSRTARVDLSRDEATRRGRYLEAAATLFEPIEMQLEPADTAVARSHRFEQTVAVREPAVRGIDARRLSVHEPERIHDATSVRPMRPSCNRRACRRHVDSTQMRQRRRLKATVPLVPPKPNEFDIATSSFAWRATLGV